MVSRRAILWVGTLLGAVFLYLAGRSVEWATLVATLKRAHVPGLLAIVACAFLHLVVKALRWRYLIRPLTNASTADLLPAVYAGNAGNLIVPHAGEVVRAVAANLRLHVPTSALLASVAVERIFDFVALLLIAMVALIPVGRMSPDLLVASYVIGALAAVILGVSAAFVIWTEGCLRIVQWALAPAPSQVREGLLRHIRAGTAGLDSIVRPQLLLPIFLLSLLQWSAIAACAAFAMATVNVSASLAAAVSVLMLNVIGLTLPAAPGHVGTVQLAFTVALAPFGVAREEAFAASVVYNFLMIATGFALGLPSLRKGGVELYRLLQANSPTGSRS
jgi:uncharacterized protein (TIRG00374 family)